MRPLSSTFATLILAAAATGCSTTNTLVADRSLLISPGVQISHQAAAGAVIAGALAWYLTDPRAPTWKVERRQLAEGRYRIDLRQKRFAIGGDGEALQVLEYAAGALAEEYGYTGFLIESYTESFESATPIGQRVSRGVVVLTRAD